MGREKTVSVRDGGTLSAVVVANEAQALERLKAELAIAFAAPDSAYEPLDAETIILRNAQ
jgi:hypothetical protein